jgi:hypothetical protein
MTQFHNISAGTAENKCDMKEVITIMKPVAAKVAKCTFVIGSSMIVSSCVFAKEAAPNTECVVIASKTAKVAKSTRDMAREIANYSTALVICAQGAVGAEGVIKENVPKHYIVGTIAMLTFCGFLIGRSVYEEV